MSRCLITLFVLWAVAAAGPAAGGTAEIHFVEIAGGSYEGARLIAPAPFEPARLAAPGRVVLDAPAGTPLAALLERAAASGQRLASVALHAAGSGVGELQECTISKAAETPSSVRFEIAYARLAAPVEPIPGGRPDPGGPDGPKNLVAPPALPNLTIGAAKPLPGGMAQLHAQVVNAGAGPSAATAVQLYYHRDGKVETASAPVPALASGQQTLVPVGINLPLAAADSVTLRVDDPNTVSETNELDNGYIVP